MLEVLLLLVMFRLEWLQIGYPVEMEILIKTFVSGLSLIGSKATSMNELMKFKNDIIPKKMLVDSLLSNRTDAL